MGKLVTIKEASERTGLSTCEIRRGIRKQTYPSIKVGEGRGKYLLDLDLLVATIDKIMIGSLMVTL
jgi:hypothetical protein